MPKAKVPKTGPKPPGPRRHVPHTRVYRELVEPGYPDITELFTKGLELLVKHLAVDQSFITRVMELGLENLWWATARGHAEPGPIHDPSRGFCALVLAHPSRALVVRDALADPVYRDHTAARELGVRSYIGVPLRNAERVMGVLSVQASKPRAFTRSDIVLVNVVASLFGNALQIELLKHELVQTREALDLAMAMVEDSAMEAPASHLPNRRYLEVWLKANLFTARRRSELIAVALCHLALNRNTRARLREVADMARGEDLLVDLGHESILVLLPRTTVEGAETFLARMRDRLGPFPIGGTLWHPRCPADFQDPTLQPALGRAAEALLRVRNGTARQGVVEWQLPELPAREPEASARHGS